MVEPSRRTSRLALAGGAVVAALFAGAGFMLGLNVRPGSAPEPAAAPAPTPAPSPTEAPIVTDTRPLDRAGLLAAVREAADAAATGRPAGAAAAALDGRRVELSLPFGCSGPAPAYAPLGWSYDGRAEALRVRAEPVRWPVADWTRADGIDAVEGFWIDRPWTDGDSCPPRSPTAAQPAAPAEQTVGVAQFHAADAPRLGRWEGEAFEAVERVAPADLDLSQGLRLRLTGRVVAAPGAGPIVCRAPTPDRRPICLLSVSLDRVTIENPATAKTLATWDVAQRRAPGSS